RNHPFRMFLKVPDFLFRSESSCYTPLTEYLLPAISSFTASFLPRLTFFSTKTFLPDFLSNTNSLKRTIFRFRRIFFSNSTNKIFRLQYVSEKSEFLHRILPSGFHPTYHNVQLALRGTQFCYHMS